MRDFDWKILATLRKTHSITEASELLFISQSTLTKRLQTIEEDLGVSLLVRGRHGFELTAVGDRIALRAETILRDIEEARGEAAASREGAVGELYLGVLYSYMSHVMPKLLADFSRENPDVKLNIVSALSQDLVRMTEDGVLDVCVARNSAKSSFLQRYKLSEDQTFVVYGRPFALEELPGLPYIEYNRNEEIVRETKRWWTERFDTQLTERYRVDNGDLCLQMVRSGLGYSFFSDEKYLLDDRAKTCYYKPLEFRDGKPFKMNTYLLYRRDSARSKALESFIRFIRQTDPRVFGGITRQDGADRQE